MGEERIGVRRFHGLRGTRECRIGVAILAERCRRRLLRQLDGSRCPADAALIRRVGAFIPGGVEFRASLFRGPPRVRDDGDTRIESRAHPGRVALDDKAMLHARHGLHGIDVRTHHLAAEHGTLGVHGIEHSRQRHVDPEHRRAAHDAARIGVGNGRADDLEVFRVLDLDGAQIGRRHVVAAFA